MFWMADTTCCVPREGEDYVHSSVYKTDHEFQALCSFDEWLFVCMWASVVYPNIYFSAAWKYWAFFGIVDLAQRICII